ncbi:hypothetical protein HAX54_034154 [Datura stramonium]|uniref:Uncharacterized protein n=1 Tax=Datura stramonium TaxID=4076 RepID=A0ABS8VG34_DATST|nr:hypothetical protein [Datura stramonium]
MPDQVSRRTDCCSSSVAASRVSLHQNRSASRLALCQICCALHSPLQQDDGASRRLLSMWCVTLVNVVSSMPRSTPHHAGRVLLCVPHRARSSVASHGLLRQECCCLACVLAPKQRRLAPGLLPNFLRIAQPIATG